MNFCLLQCAPAEQLGFCFPVCKHIVLVGVSFLWLVFYSDPYPNDHNQIYLYIFPNILWDPNYPCLGTIAVCLFSFLFQQDMALQHLWAALAWFSPSEWVALFWSDEEGYRGANHEANHIGWSSSLGQGSFYISLEVQFVFCSGVRYF